MKRKLFYDFSWKCRSIGVEYSSWVDHGIDTSFYMVCDNGSELSTSRIGKFTFDWYENISIIMAKIGSHSPSTEIDMIPNNAISDITQMCNIGMISECRIFDFDTRSQVTILTDNRIAT